MVVSKDSMAIGAMSLRNLSRAYAAGALDFASYRRERRALLQRVADGAVPVVAFESPEPDAPTVFPPPDRKSVV